jgi:hypothetical protein
VKETIMTLYTFPAIRVAVPIVLALAFFGCDDGPSIKPKSYDVSFIYPEATDERLVLTCGDDRDRSSPDVIDLSITVNAEVPEDERDDIIVELSVTPETFPSQRRSLTDGGRVIFSGVELTEGEYSLTVKLLSGTIELATSELELRAEIDAASPLCGVAQSELRFSSPVGGQLISAADDLDQDLTNGIQIPVTVEVEGPLVDVGSQVEVQVNGANFARATVMEGVAQFESITLPLTGTPQLRALATGPNGLLEDIINVTVNADACELTLSPEPAEGCDVGSTADVDTERPGLQAELTAQSTCNDVIWTVNGREYPAVSVVNGQATLTVTLSEGENTVSARAQSSNGLAAAVDTYILDVDLTDPELSIEQFQEIGVNQRSLSDALLSFDEEGRRQVSWVINGFTSDLPAGTQATFELLPPLEGAPSEVMIDDQGRFSVELTGEYICGRQLTLRASDQCGGEHQSVTYSLCFDGVTPRLSIVEPDNLTLINEDLDSDEEGLQTDFVIRVEDRREDVEYPIEIQCTRGVGGAPEVVNVTELLRSQLTPIEGEAGVSQGSVRVTFPRADRYTCQPVAMTGNNEPTLAISAFRVITDEPIFEVLDPTVVLSGTSRDYACFSDVFFIGGRGSQFSDEGTQLSYTLYNASGQVARFGQLADQGDGYFSASVDLSDQQLADGRYLLEISGVSGSVDISVLPSEPIPLLIDNEPPVIGPLAPANGRLTLADDQDSDLSNCIQASANFSLSDESAERICFRLNGGAPQCSTVLDQGEISTPVFNFLPGENVISTEVIDCTGTTSSFDFSITTEGCSIPLRVTNWSDGAGVTLLNDEVEDQQGLQVTLSLSGLPNEVVTLGLSAPPLEDVSLEPIALDTNGEGNIIVTLPTQEGSPVDVTLTPVSSSRTGQALRLTSYSLTPQLNFRPLSEMDCLNSSVKDLSASEGFQLRFIIDADGLSSAGIPEFSVFCSQEEGGRSQVDTGSATVINLGQSAVITSDLLTLQDGQCEIQLDATDVSGAPLSATLPLLIDRSAPVITLVSPSISEPLNLLNDQSSSDAGIQFPAEFSVCGAAGSVEVSLDNGSNDAPVSVELGEDECSVVTTQNLTFINGEQLLTATAVDSCGNSTLFEQNIQGNTGVTLVITSPDDQDLISAGEDLDSEIDGCQLQVRIATTGFTSPDEVTFALCASQQPGMLSPLCGTQPDVSGGECERLDADGRDISCPITLNDGDHELRLVARENGVDLSSSSISVFVDCSPPEVIGISVAEDLDDDSCINSQERLNYNSVGPNATFNVNFEVSGFDDGQRVTLRGTPGQLSLGQAVISEGRGSLQNVSLPPGDYQLYLTGVDRVGNTLPQIGSPNLVAYTLKIDTTTSAPILLRPNPNECLGQDDDLEVGGDAQYAPSISTGAQDGERLSLTLGFDGIPVQSASTQQATFNFDQLQLSEGAHDLTIVVEDECGNAGSVSGFVDNAGRPNWSAPLPVPVSVDLTSPTLTLNGATVNQVFSPEDDANQSPADGFQIEMSVVISGVEAGQEIQLFSGEERLATQPIRLLTSGAAEETINVTLTLPPGPHALSARTSDACQNPAQTPALPITIDINGCSSLITNLSSGQLFGPASGTVTPDNQLRIDVSGQVDLLDPECVNAQAELLLNGADLLGSSGIQAGTGLVSFNEVSIPEGEHSLSIRVRLNNEDTTSLGKQVIVDLTAPEEITISAPVLTNNRGLVLEDNNPEIAGQQFSIVAQVTEVPSTTQRTGRLSIDGVLLPTSVVLSEPDASGVSELRMNDVNAPPREAVYQLCVIDEVQNERCTSFTLEADPKAPNGISFTTQVNDARIPEVEVSFTAPGDDGNGGDIVSAYEVRWSRAQINNDASWDNATALSDLSPSALPNTLETLSLQGLPPNELIYISIRARDNVGRLGPIRSSTVDTRLQLVTIDIAPAGGGTWGADIPSTLGNPIHSIGDFDGDGATDLLVTFAQYNFQSTAQVIFGNSLDAPRTLALTPPAELPLLFGNEGAHLGDVNGDGASDIIIAGYTGTFSSAFAIYFGCVPAQLCDPVELGTADVVLTTTGTLRTSVASAGDFASRLGAGFDDIVIGGGQAPNGSYTDPLGAMVIEGRAQWPATIDVTLPDQNNGVYALTLGIANGGSQVASAGDLDQDGDDELLLSAGGNIDQTFIVYGGDPLDMGLMNGEWVYIGSDPNFIELTNPCPELGNTSFGILFKGSEDFNGDGRDDFIVGNYVDEALSVFSGDLSRLDCFKRGEAGFSARFDIAGDINGDGALDLIVVNESEVLAQREEILIFYNDGLGLFGANEITIDRKESMRVTRPVGPKYGASAAGDLNLDGSMDFATFSLNETTSLFQVGLLY